MIIKLHDLKSLFHIGNSNHDIDFLTFGRNENIISLVSELIDTHTWTSVLMGSSIGNSTPWVVKLTNDFKNIDCVEKQAELGVLIYYYYQATSGEFVIVDTRNPMLELVRKSADERVEEYRVKNDHDLVVLCRRENIDIHNFTTCMVLMSPPAVI
jgi:hypothetical protein